MITGAGGNTPYQATFTQSTDKTDAAVITLPIQLYQPAVLETIVTITATGTAKPSVADYGTGKNYTLSATLTQPSWESMTFTATVTILAGATAPASPVTLTVFDNPLFSLDKVASFAFTNNRGYAMTYSTANITIVDDAAASKTLDVTQNYPAKSLTACVADGATDDGAAFQAFLYYLRDNGGGLLKIPKDKQIAILAYAGGQRFLPCKQQITISGDMSDGGGRTAGIFALPMSPTFTGVVFSNPSAQVVLATTLTPHGYTNGDKVFVSGLSQLYAYKPWVITKVDDYSFTLNGAFWILKDIVFSQYGTDGVIGSRVSNNMWMNDIAKVTGCSQAYANTDWTVTTVGEDAFVLNGASWALFNGADVTGDVDGFRGADVTGNVIKINETTMFSTVGADNQWATDGSDSPGLVFENLTLDQNGPNQAAWGFYAQEQAFLFYIGANLDYSGRVKSIWDNCHTKDGLADGITIGVNADVRIYNTDFTDCLRGGPVAVGGYSKVDYRNGTCYKVNRDFRRGLIMSLQEEQYPGSDGYGGSYKVDWNIVNVNMEGYMNIESLDGGVVTINNVNHTGLINECGFMNGCTDSTWDISGGGSWICQSDVMNTFNDLGNVTIEDQTFIGTRRADGTVPAGAGAINIGNASQVDGVAIFERCTFLASNDPTWGIYGLNKEIIHINVNTVGLNPTYTFKDCVYGDGYGYAFSIGGSGFKHCSIIIDGGTFNQTFSGAAIADLEDETGSRSFDLTIKNISDTNLGGLAKFLYITRAQAGAGSTITWDNVTISAAKNVLDYYIYACGPGDVNNYTITGYRTINASNNTAPTGATHCFVGDRYVLLNTNVYTCTYGGMGSGAEWSGP